MYMNTLFAGQDLIAHIDRMLMNEGNRAQALRTLTNMQQHASQEASLQRNATVQARFCVHRLFYAAVDSL